ncbi:MAG: transketolase family protein [Acetivibrionales bacterium]|jgi:transketolase|nr:transketolase family protein [Clostridiaceae bacterium]
MSEKMATRVAYGKTLAEIGQDENIVVLDADLSKSTRTDFFKDKYPERHFNIGIAEGNMMAVAAGLASCGKTVFASTFAVFAAGRAYDSVRNSIGYPHLNVKIGATHAGITVGEDGASHQMLEDIALMRAIPGMTVISPSDAVSTTALVKQAAQMNGPVYLRLGRLDVPVIYPTDTQFQIGKGVQVKDGKDITLIATGMMLDPALKAAENLEKEGVSARVIDIHTIKPIDADIIIKAAKETGAIVTCEEHNILGGLGSAVAEVVVKNCPVPMELVGVKDTFGKSGKPADLLVKYGLTAENIMEKSKELLKKK